MSGVYSLSTTVDITFILPKLDLKKPTKKQLNFSNSIFCSVWKTEQLFNFIFHLFLKVLYKSILVSVVKVPYKPFYYLLLLVATYYWFITAKRTL